MIIKSRANANVLKMLIWLTKENNHHGSDSSLFIIINYYYYYCNYTQTEEQPRGLKSSIYTQK